MVTASFPPEFMWGVATAAYQAEGAAADHDRRWPEDIALLRELGVGAYRLSLSWPRVQPGGRGPLNPEGVAFYRRLLTAVRDAGIDPVVTLYHRDLPPELEDAGGWPERATAEAFAGYARAVARELGDLVALWITVNEPWCSAFLGYASGVRAPGRTDPAAALAAAHHLSLGHGLATRAIRDELGDQARVAVALNLHVTRPADPESAADLEAAHEIDLVGNHVFLGPMLEGTYPLELKEQTAHLTDWSFVRPGDLVTTRQRLDALGVNYYSTNYVRRAAPREGSDPSWDHGEGGAGPWGYGEGGASPWVGADAVAFVRPAERLTAMGGHIEPEGLTELLTALAIAHEGLPLLVTANGAAFEDVVAADAAIHDAERTRYLTEHVTAVARAREAGADVRGYFVWSLLDTSEGTDGSARRFGLVHVDDETRGRTPKDSFHWYRALVRTGRLPDLRRRVPPGPNT